ncbi:MAG: tRNA 4-thiouridine(8) synthase ThiI [Clostridia bacterium]|nr:tRNA 4-thiouridine(8) synthase ThiI [Clostridia bacterium]
MDSKKQVVLARIGEIALKGLNRHKFVEKVVKNLQWRLEGVGPYLVTSSQSRIWAEPMDEESASPEKMADALNVACRVFGIVSASLVSRIGGGFEEICREANLQAAAELAGHSKALTFKVECRRGRKNFPMTSPEVAVELGAFLLEQQPRLSVDVNQPDFVVYVEIREDIFVYTKIIPGIKGLPIGTAGKAMLLLSGGIDSPVAGYLMASRGLQLEAVYFHSFPFTSDEAKEKVITLARIISEYSGRIRLHIVNFTEIQVLLRQHCPSDMLTIVMRRVMMRIAERIAREQGCKALITGESLGQVASQTLEGLVTTNSVVDMPVFQPLIGLDKDFTTTIARQIGTFETSILPYEDCCTVFVAKHPKTKPSRKDAENAEAGLDIEALVEEGFTKREHLLISGRRA